MDIPILLAVALTALGASASGSNYEGPMQNSQKPPRNCCYIKPGCPPKICGKCEECKFSSKCQESCAYFNGEVACSQEVTKGCYCKNGFARNSKGFCVKVNDCREPKICDKNEEYQCGNNCTESCEYQSGKILCAQYCIDGCFCKEGFARNSYGDCVKKELCEQMCDKNEEYQCGNNCTESCEYQSGKIPCPQYCIDGCYCQSGFARNSYGDCVKKSLCSLKCRDNEVQTDCVIPCNNCVIKGLCSFLRCESGCDCRKGYYRNKKGTCIPEDQCPTKYCDQNEEYKCGSSCTESCDYQNGEAVCTLSCTYDCYCKEDYARNSYGDCVKKEFCDAEPTCKGDYEKYYDCKPNCTYTCDNYEDEDAMCTEECKSGCACEKGYVKDSYDNCVSPEDCPQSQGYED